MARIWLFFVVFCIGSIQGLPQEIANPSNDSKPSDLTKNLIENPSSVDSKPSDLTEIVVFAMKQALKFIWNQANCLTGLRPRQELDATILGNCYYDWNPESVFYASQEAFFYVYFSILTFMLNVVHNNNLLLQSD